MEKLNDLISEVEFSLPVNSKELENIKLLLMLPNNLQKIHFTKESDINTLINIKYLLEMSDYKNTLDIKKYIISPLITKNKSEIFQLNFKKASNWYINMDIGNNNFILLDIPSWKTIYKLEEGFNYSDEFDTVLNIYNYIKSFKRNDSLDIAETLLEKAGNSKSLNDAFLYLIRSKGIQGDVIKSEKGYFTMVFLKDGVYFFDPFQDKESSFNYFYLTVKEVFNIDTLMHEFKYLGYQNFNIDMVEINKREEREDLFNRCQNTLEIDKASLFTQIIKSIDIHDKERLLNDMLDSYLKNNKRH